MSGMRVVLFSLAVWGFVGCTVPLKPPPSHPSGLAQVAAASGHAGQVGASLELLPFPAPSLADLTGSYARPLGGGDDALWLEGGAGVSGGHLAADMGVWKRFSKAESNHRFAVRFGGAGGTGDQAVLAAFDMPYVGANLYGQWVSVDPSKGKSFGITLGLEYLSPLNTDVRVADVDNQATKKVEEDSSGFIDVKTRAVPVQVLWPSVDFRWDRGVGSAAGTFFNLRLYLYSKYWGDVDLALDPEMNMTLAGGVRF